MTRGPVNNLHAWSRDAPQRAAAPGAARPPQDQEPATPDRVSGDGPAQQGTSEVVSAPRPSRPGSSAAHQPAPSPCRSSSCADWGPLCSCSRPCAAVRGRRASRSRCSPRSAPPCVTGLAVVDTATYWTPLGQAAILVLIQIGGFGIQALGTLWILLLNRRLGTRSRLAAQAETGALTQGDVRQVLTALAAITVVVEAAVGLLPGARGSGGPTTMSLAEAAWNGDLPQRQRLQQRRVRPRPGLPDVLRPGPVGPGADRRGDRARRPGLPRDRRGLPPVHGGPRDRPAAPEGGDDPGRGARPRPRAGPALALPDGGVPPGAVRLRQPHPDVAAHPPHAHRHRHRDGGRSTRLRPLRVDQPEHARCDALVGEGDSSRSSPVG